MSFSTLYEVKIEDGEVLATRRLNPDCDWAAEGRATAFVEVHGLNCKIEKGELYKYHIRKLNAKGRKRLKDNVSYMQWPETFYCQAPDGWEPIHKPDNATGLWPGWIKVSDTSNNDKWFVAGFKDLPDEIVKGSEHKPIHGVLVGPKVLKNPYGLEKHFIVPRFGKPVDPIPQGIDALIEYFQRTGHYGLLYRNNNTYSRMAYIRRTHFGLPWPAVEQKK